MVQNPPPGYQRIIPYLLYADADGALAYLSRCFGLQERFRIPAPEGKIGHAELALGDSVVMLASAVPDMGHASQRELPGRSAMIVVYVDDVDAHHAHAKAAGAEVLSEPEDQFYGDRTYRARDPEGHEWYFHTHVRDVPPEELAGAPGG